MSADEARPAAAGVWAVRARTAAVTLLLVAAGNGLAPVLGHAPVGTWSPARGAVQEEPANSKSQPDLELPGSRRAAGKG